MRENLLGYLLGALEAHEREHVELELERDPALRRDVERLDAHLELLRADRERFDPPAGLAQRTCAFVTAQTATEKVAPARAKMSAAYSLAAPRGSWSLMDLVVAGGICMAAALLFFPAIANSRYQAQLAVCQNNLRQVGGALARYSVAHAGLFPQVETSGRRAVAGIYAPILYEGGFVTEENCFVCPGSPLARELEGAPFKVVSLKELDEADSPTASLLQRTLGGSYGFNLGYTLDGKHYAPRNLGRSQYALLADAPSPLSAGRQSVNHGGSGQNVFFEDGHVRFLRLCQGPECGGDNFYVSDRGHVEAGTHPNDAVIAESAATPVPWRARLHIDP
jgi:hypothetical protein